MTLLIESIKVWQKKFYLLDLHEQRFNAARKHFFGATPICLQQTLTIPNHLDSGLYKCRIVFDEQIQTVEFQHYEPKPPRTLQVVRTDHVDYAFKYADRNHLNQLFAQRQNADDILILKHGYFTDTWYCNIAFYDGQEWFTPDRPLLNGIKRQFLLANKQLKALPLGITDLHNFVGFALINAMLDLDTAYLNPIGNIWY